MEPFEAELAQAKNDAVRLRDALASVVLGQDEVIEQVLWALVAGGHVLLEGNPGLGKTLLVRTLAACLKLEFSRIQFTPDLMPSDITGTNVLVSGAEAGRRFELHRGPIFGQVVLADEINRATPKTQSALLEAMQEHAVTIGGTRYALEEPFFVLATENPIEMEGTYPLPEAQLDRFLVKVLVSSPSEAGLCSILQATTGRAPTSPAPVLDSAEVLRLRGLCRDVVISEPVVSYAARLVTASSPDAGSATGLVQKAVRYGAGVRGAQALVLVAKAIALLDGRAHAGFGDIQRAAKPALRHRILRSFEGEADRISADHVIDELLATIPTLPESVERAVKGA